MFAETAVELSRYDTIIRKNSSDAMSVLKRLKDQYREMAQIC